jgi:lysophospholipase L1-like esterase
MSDARRCAPSSRRRIGRHTLVVLMGLAAALLWALPATAGASTKSYVSIGDSYTSGPGVLPYEESEQADEHHCARSTRNYPHLVAAALKLSLTDVSCGGATTSDETESQIPGIQPPQDEALSESTEVVTIGMGGNDGGLFGTLLFGCTEVDVIHPEPGKAPCETKYSKFVTETFAADKPAEEAALVHIKELAPHAKVFVVGYPDIAPKTSHCIQFPWHDADMKWFRNKVEKIGNKMIKAGAKAHGAIFVESFKGSEEHNACQEPGVRWVEPLIGSLTGVPVHPNAEGEEALAYDVELAMLKAGIRP